MILYRLDFANGKAYIGITTRSPEGRWREHQQQAGSRAGKMVNAAERCPARANAGGNEAQAVRSAQEVLGNDAPR